MRDYFVFTILSFVLLAQVQDIDCRTSLRVTDRMVKALGNYIRQKANTYEDASDLSVFYNLDTNETIREMMPHPWYKPGQSLRLPFIGQPCSCSGLQCGCCAGIRIEQFAFNRKACVNLTYDPFLFGIVMDITVDNYSVFHNVFSAKNPPPVCVPVVIGGVPTGIEFCVKLFDIHTIGTNLHVCMDFEVRIASAPVLVLHFDCLELGTEGVALAKPDTGDIVESDSTTIESETVTYDPVTEIKYHINEYEGSTLNPIGIDQSITDNPNILLETKTIDNETGNIIDDQSV